MYTSDRRGSCGKEMARVGKIGKYFLKAADLMQQSIVLMMYTMLGQSKSTQAEIDAAVSSLISSFQCSFLSESINNNLSAARVCTTGWNIVRWKGCVSCYPFNSPLRRYLPSSAAMCGNVVVWKLPIHRCTLTDVHADIKRTGCQMVD